MYWPLPTVVGLAVLALVGQTPLAAGAAERPNILWITSEDNGPQMGCYGDEFATTPQLDRLAARGLLYRNCWSDAPVCAPARTSIISGLYPPSTGSEHMRSMARLPDGMSMYPQYLRAAGYYATNNSKEDYNLEQPGQVWDESSPRAHWRNRPEGQPFFAIFNLLTTHESRIRQRPHEAHHDPAEVPLPAYHPDAPEVRQDWAQYYDKMMEMDAQVGQLLEELEEAGLAEDTIVFYYGDHGPGMPRGKRWLYQSGLWVPLIVHIPERFRHLAPEEYQAGAATDRLVGFVDLAPTVLSLAGVEPPEHMQGVAFLGPHAQPPREYLYGFRGRMDERYDLSRAVRDQRYLYIRNFMPHRVYGQYLWYMFETPTTRVWKELYDAGSLAPPQTYFWEPKPAEELYDLHHDPNQVRNLTTSPDHQDALRRLRAELRRWSLDIRDLGFLPEEEIHTRSQDTTPYEMARDARAYPLERILAVAELAAAAGGRSSNVDPLAVDELQARLGDPDSAVRYWAAMGLLIRGREAVAETRTSLREALDDASPSVQVMAAEALGRYGDPGDVERALERLVRLANLQRHSLYTSVLALNAVAHLGERAAPIYEQLAALPTERADVDRRMNDYVPRLLETILADLERHQP